MLGSGAVVAIAEGTDLLAAATNVLRFFRNESCGKCVPCRVGSTKAHAILSDLIDSGGGPEDVDDRIVELEKTMRLTSICGLGQVALGPAISVLGLKRGGTEARPSHGRRERRTRPPAPTASADGARPPATLAPGVSARGQREFFTVKTVSEALSGFRPERRTPPRASASTTRSAASPPSRSRAARTARLRARDRRRLRRPRRRHVRRVRGSPELPRPRRRGAHGPAARDRGPPGTAVAIATGAPLPPGADAVLKIEHTQAATPELLEVLRPVTPGEGMVRADEDAAPGDELARAGRPLRAQDLGMLAAAGIVELAVHARPRVAIVSTGDELVPRRRPGASPVGQVRDSSAPALAALVREAGGEPHFAGIVPDDRDALTEKLREALNLKGLTP